MLPIDSGEPDLEEALARLDPGRRYPAYALRYMDRVAWMLLHLMPAATMERTRDVYQFTLEDPGGIVVLITPEELQIRLPSIDYTTGYWGPVSVSRPFKKLRIADRIPSEKSLPCLA